ncbi:glycerol kinase GlpK [Angustibacter sp. Root456]|uniref:glycerol kinase GlpK n=1 Tax=Angustibacter sp. Root456 TaxID=1736539 RepID=UPI000701DA42|nr:glycerol kinase GlpK [Angustibacter sp. Root456]KQX66884.1 glycerol kinase [Angustibacter sp. Root456]
MTERYVAALDQGTTSTRCLVFDHQGRLVSLAQRLHRQSYPRPGWVEHDAEEIWEVVRRIVPEALADAGIDPSQVVALGVTNQRETTVVWDRASGRPVAPAIVWQDTRTADLLPSVCRTLTEDEIHERTGLPLTTYFSGPKLRWLLDTVPGLQERAERGEVLFGTMDTWLLWNLTGGVDGGVHATDITNASRTQLMNLRTGEWDDELLACMGVPAAMLPQIRPSVGGFGTTVDPVPGIPVAAVIGDQQASLFGQTAFEPGDGKCTFGTGAFLLLNTGQQVVRSRHGLVTTVAHQLDGEPPVYALEGSVAVAGALVEWCRESLGLIRTPAEIETLAASVTDNGGCYVVPAFAGLYAPHWQPQAQGVVVGLTSYVKQGHIARAVLEATALQTQEVARAMQSDSGVPLRVLAVDGGMTANNLLMQAVADLLDVPVVRPMMAETVALGAAYAAGLASGYWPDQHVLRRQWHRAAEWRPQMTCEARAHELERWSRAIELAIAWGEPPR